jgi:hypothetical protein
MSRPQAPQEKAAARAEQPAAPPPGVVMPPAPPGESSPEAVQKTRAVAGALTELGQHADPQQVARHIRDRQGASPGAGEVAAIQAELLRQAQTPPGPDQPPGRPGGRPAR